MFRFWNIPKLVTHEDKFHAHKTMGVLTLGNYAYRISTHNFDLQWDTVLMVNIHAALSLSSLIFSILPNKNKAIPMIWPEFRLHSIIFAFRSFIAVVLSWCVFIPPRIQALSRMFLVMGTMVAADTVTDFYKDLAQLSKIDSTMRTMPYPPQWSPNTIRRIKYFYSTSQMIATSGILISPCSYTLLITAMPIQLAAFLMTLVRKSIISSTAWHIYYGLSLAAAVWITTPTWGAWMVNYIVGVFLMELRRSMDKYFLWSLWAFVMSCLV